MLIKIPPRLLLVKENFLHCFGIFSKSCKKLDKQTIERIFASYDTVSTLASAPQ